MNRPCRLYFHEDAAPLYEQLPERYRRNVENYNEHTSGGVISSLLVQHAFPIDFTHGTIIRTRAGGKDESPIDFPLASLSHIEWFYDRNLPSPLKYVEPKPPKTPYTNQNREG